MNFKITDSDKLAILSEFVQNLLKPLETQLEEHRENRVESGMSQGSFYDLYVDEDGIPFSNSNANDVYDDGYQAGTYEGEYDAYNSILNKIRELSK